MKQQSDWKEENPEHRKEYSRDYYRKNRTQVDMSNKEYAERNKEALQEQRRFYARKHKYNISKQQYEKAVEDQNGCCAICEDGIDNLWVDHCHETGAVRGLLCNSCNAGLGFFRDSPEIMERAIQYIINFNNTGGPLWLNKKKEVFFPELEKKEKKTKESKNKRQQINTASSTGTPQKS